MAVASAIITGVFVSRIAVGVFVDEFTTPKLSNTPVNHRLVPINSRIIIPIRAINQAGIIFEGIVVGVSDLPKLSFIHSLSKTSR